MRDALVFTKEAPATSLTVDTTVYIGKNQIRRNVGHSTSLYMVGSVTDDYLELNPGETVELNPYYVDIQDLDTFDSGANGGFASSRRIEGLVLQVDAPLIARIDGMLDWAISKILVLDAPCDSVRVTNPQATKVNLHITRAASKIDAPRLQVNAMPCMSMAESTAGFRVEGVTNVVGSSGTSCGCAPTVPQCSVLLTLNKVQYACPVDPVTGSWSVDIPANTITENGMYLLTAVLGTMVASQNLTVCP